jgi:LysM repeat protein
MAQYPARPLRFTARGRFVIGLSAGFIALVGTGLVNTAVAANDDPGHIVVVQEGESLWTIAQTVAPNADPRAVIHDIKSRNGLQSSVVHVGQALQVPSH